MEEAMKYYERFAGQTLKKSYDEQNALSAYRKEPRR
jgi:hypothetical protein